MELREFIKALKEAIKEEDLEKVSYYYDLSQLFTSATVPLETAVRLILLEIAKRENKKIVMNVVLPQLDVSSEVVFKGLKKINRDLYKPCLDVRKHRNFLACLLNAIDKEEFKAAVDFINKFYGYEHLWWTDLLAR